MLIAKQNAGMHLAYELISALFRWKIMHRLFERIFKKEPQLNYIIAEYQPSEMNFLKTDARFTEYYFDEVTDIEEMKVDKLEAD